MVITPRGQYGRFMTCPLTGMLIPKRVDENLQWRKRLRDAAEHNPKVQAELRAACKASIYFWINAFAWTFQQKRVGLDGVERPVSGSDSHQPFITWKVQDDALASIIHGINFGEDLLISKSRDMGASWLILTAFHWYWQFKPNTTFLEMSRKAQLVDKRGDMDSLIEKHRYLHKWQPSWLRPQKVTDNVGHFVNEDIDTAIVGESTNENAGQASRKTAILLDEYSRMPNAAEIDLATDDTSSCRIFNSTPSGPNTHFSKKFFSGQVKVVVLPWIDHPLKAHNLRLVDSENGQKWAPAGKRYESDWYCHEEATRSKKNIAQNIDMDQGQAGDMFFDANELALHRTAFERDPEFRADIVWDDEYPVSKIEDLLRASDRSKLRLRKWPGGKWRVWAGLIDGRLNPLHRYVVAADISGGTGASNSVLSVLDDDTNQIVAKFWDAFTSPDELADTAVMVCHWIGGQGCRPVLIWENNGPGGIFGRRVQRLRYDNIYYQRIEDTRGDKRTGKIGWNSNDVKKERLLGDYRDALRTRSIINPCHEAIEEAGLYIYNDRGQVVPGMLTSEEGGGQALHGDHVIADALTLVGRKELPKNRELQNSPPAGSFQWRKKKWTRARTRGEWDG